MTEETIVELPLDKIHDSPTQPRTSYSSDELAEMAQTMRPPGRVHQAIVVRPHPSIAGEYECVFGHKRRRAAELAERETIPAVVREMSDEDVKVAQIVENLQRSNVSPIDEADAMAQLRDQHGASIEQLMERAGKGRTYVYNRLRLAAAHSDVREAVINGMCDAEVAQEVARRPLPLQTRALYAVRTLSFRNAKAELERSFQFKLSSAPFDPLSIKLVPEAGGCDACPKRSDAEPVLLEECGPGVCMDGACYGMKATVAREIREKAEREAAAKKSTEASADSSFNSPAMSQAWPFPRKGASTQQQQSLLPAGGADEQEDEVEDLAPPTASERARAADTRPPEVQAVSNQWESHVGVAVAKALAQRARTTDDMRTVVRGLVAFYDGLFLHSTQVAMGWREEFQQSTDEEALAQHKIATATADQLATIMVVEAFDRLCDEMSLADRVAERLAMCKLLDINPIEAAEMEPADDPAQARLDDEPPAAPPAPAAAEKSSTVSLTKPGAKSMKYRDAATGSTWSGKGLKPKWLTVALANGKTLADFAV